LFFLASLTFAQEVTLTGKWTFQISAAGNESQQECTFTQTGKDLKGTCKTQRQDNVEVTGQVDGKSVAFVYKTQYENSPLTVSFKGTVEADKMSGKIMAEEFGVEGEFTAAAVKP